MRRCHKCGHELHKDLEVHRSTVCPSCDADLRCCLSCRFYSKGVHWDCVESIDEQVRNKDRGNFCGFFSFRTSGEGAAAPSAGDQKTRNAFDGLFSN